MEEETTQPQEEVQLQSKTEMVELSISINDMMNYDICIPRVITPQTFPEILKRLKAVVAIIPEEELVPIQSGSTNPVLVLDLEQSKDLFKIYKNSEQDEFKRYLATNYKLEYPNRSAVVALMGRVKTRIKKMEDKQ